MRGEIGVILLIVGLLAGAGVGYLFGTANQKSVTTTSVSTATIVQTVTQGSEAMLDQCGFSESCQATNPSGMILSLQLNETTVRSNSSFLFEVTEFNPSLHNISMAASDSWYLPGLNDYPCNSGSTPYGAEVFRGHYTLGNISSGVNVLSFALGRLGLCIYSGNPSIFNFTAGSAFVPPVANLQGFQQVYAINGYTLNGPPSPTATFVNSIESSQPAVYTFVAGDEWGDTVLLYFQVVGPA